MENGEWKMARRRLLSSMFILNPRAKLVEPEAVATSPYRIKSPVPVCCGFDSSKSMKLRNAASLGCNQYEFSSLAQESCGNVSPLQSDGECVHQSPHSSGCRSIPCPETSRQKGWPSLWRDAPLLQKEC